MSSRKEIQMWIDNLKNSIVNTISGDSLPSEVSAVKSSDLKMITITSGWNFNWKAEAKLADSIVYKLTILNRGC